MKLTTGARYGAVVAVPYPRFLASPNDVRKKFVPLGFPDAEAQEKPFDSSPEWLVKPPQRGNWTAYVRGTYTGPTRDDYKPASNIVAWEQTPQRVELVRSALAGAKALHGMGKRPGLVATHGKEPGTSGEGVILGADGVPLRTFVQNETTNSIDIFPTVIGGQAVVDRVNQVNPSIVGFAGEVHLARPDWESQFSTWYQAWETFRREVIEDPPFLTAKAKLAQADTFVNDLGAWRAKYKETTKHNPQTPPPADLLGGGIDFPTIALGGLGGMAVVIVGVGLLLWVTRR